MDKIRMAVVGAGSFGRNHLRVIGQSEGASLVAAVDSAGTPLGQAASEFNCLAFTDWRELAGKVDAAVVAVPTTAHAEVGCGLMEAGIDVLVEKPLAANVEDAARLVETARATGRVLQVGHLERFNPAVAALREIVKLPLFFEVHRLSVFTPRSLDVDVVLDLMIHDLDIVLAFTGLEPVEVRAAGISILSGKVDIANARLAFQNGCVANLTASRVSTEKVRKLRLFQPHQYISVDYSSQDGAVLSVEEGRQISFRPLPVNKREPLATQLDSFLGSVRNRSEPVVSGESGLRALRVALGVLDKIKEHSQLVSNTLAGWRK